MLLRFQGFFFAVFFVRIARIHTTRTVSKIISGEITQSHPDKTVLVPCKQPLNYLQLSDCSFTEPPSNVTQTWIASLLRPCESTEVWGHRRWEVGDLWFKATAQQTCGTKEWDPGMGQRTDCVPVSTWATSLSTDPSPWAPTQIEKCNQRVFGLRLGNLLCLCGCIWRYIFTFLWRSPKHTRQTKGLVSFSRLLFSVVGKDSATVRDSEIPQLKMTFFSHVMSSYGWQLRQIIQQIQQRIWNGG